MLCKTAATSKSKGLFANDKKKVHWTDMTERENLHVSHIVDKSCEDIQTVDWTNSAGMLLDLKGKDNSISFSFLKFQVALIFYKNDAFMK